MYFNSMSGNRRKAALMHTPTGSPYILSLQPEGRIVIPSMSGHLNSPN